MLSDKEIETYLEFVTPYYEDRDVGHDLKHITRIFRRLRELSEGIDPPPTARKLYFLTTFHGLGSKLADDDNFQKRTVRFLKTLGWKFEEISASFSSLGRHLSDPQTVEEMIVHDANYVEVTGAFGVAKAFTVGGVHGQTYEQTLEIFEANLDKLVFQTPVGRTIYETRKEKAREFIRDLRDELETAAP